MTEEADDAMVVLSTFPNEAVAGSVARAVVEEQLAACASLTAVRSIYRWQGAVQDDAEVLAVVKTTRARVPALTARITALHPYEVPEAIALPIDGGHAPYLAWLRTSVGGG